MGAAILTIKTTDVVGNKRMHTGTGTLSASYAANGDTFTALALGLMTVDHLSIEGSGAIMFEPDVANLKIKAIFPTGGATTAPTTQANPIVTTGASSATAVDAVTPNITPGKGKEVAATANLTAVTFRWSAIGS